MIDSDNNSNTLLAVYDLSVCPVNFDFFEFLVLAEIERRCVDAYRVYLLVVPGEDQPFFEGMSYSADDKRWRLANIILPGFALLPTCSGVSLCAERNQAQVFLDGARHVFPNGYDLNRPVGYYSKAEVTVRAATGHAVPGLRAPAQAHAYVRDWLDNRSDGRKSVVITLRQSIYDPEKNSDIVEWAAFARNLDPKTFFPVVVPDTEAVFRAPDPELRGLTLFPEAAVNVILRAALYKVAYLNMFSIGGGGSLCKNIHKARYQFFRVAVPGTLDCNFEIMQAISGTPIEGQLPYAGPFQKYVWRPDTRDVLEDEFAKMVDLIEGRIAPSEYRPVKPDSPLVIADRMERYQRHAQARDIYSELLRVEPNDFSLLLRIAKSENNLGMHESAFVRLEKIRRELGSDAEILEQWAYALSGLGRAEEAAHAYTGVLENSKPGSGVRLRSAVKLAMIYSDAGRLGDMITMLQAELHNDSQNPVIHRAMGEMLEKHGFEREAAMCLNNELNLQRRRLAEGDPNNLEAQIRVGVLENKMGRPREALKILESVLARDQARWEIHEHMGDAHAALSEYDSAVEHYRQAIKRSWGRQASFHFKLAQALKANGAVQEAIDAVLKSQRLAKDYLPNYALLIELLQSAGRMDEARDYMLMAREIEALGSAGSAVSETR